MKTGAEYTKSVTGLARQVASKPGKFQRFGKSRHCCGFTACTAQIRQRLAAAREA